MKTFILLIAFVVQSSFAANPLRTEADKLWEKRDVKESLEQALAKYETLQAQNPTDLEVLEYLSRGHYLLANSHLEDKSLKMKHFELAKKFGETGMATNSAFKAELDKGKDIEDAVGVLTVKEVPVIYWSAASLGKWARLNGVFSSLKYKDQILSMIKKVEQLKPDFFYGAVPRFWGGFYGSAPSIAGGDLDKSKKKFEESMQMAPEYLGTKVLYAEIYLTKKDDEKEFKKVLEEVKAAPLGPKELQPENALEKKRAQYLLDNIEELM